MLKSTGLDTESTANFSFINTFDWVLNAVFNNFIYTVTNMQYNECCH